MKRFAISLASTSIIAVLLLATGCSDKEVPEPGSGENPGGKSYTHAQLLKFNGNIKQVRMFYLIPEEGNLLKLDVTFDARGNCTAYDPTGIDFSEEATTLHLTTRDWGVVSARYTYSYDTGGRMIRATRYEIGADPVVFEITYGMHNSYVVTPFPLGDITPFLLQGVAGISSSDYELTCDGNTTAETATIVGWPRSSINQTTWTYDGTMPVKAETISYARQQDGSKGDELSHSETLHSYYQNELERIEKTTTIPLDEETSEIEKTTIGYSREWPYTPIFKEITSNDPDQNFRMEYNYMDNGQPKNAKIVAGYSFTEVEFEQHYVEYDDAGNWTEAVRTIIQGSDKTEVSVQRTLTSY